jgi:ferritin-like metal-binding protein YciE
MQLDNLKDLFVHQIQDLYSAEDQALKVFPKMMENISNQELKQAFEKHLNETEQQKQRLEQICDMIGIKPGGEKCKAMEGLVKESEDLMKQKADPDVMDAGLIAAQQRVEHYEIAGYGTARVYAQKLGNKDVERLLSETLNEEKKTDELLTDIAVKSINEKAMS